MKKIIFIACILLITMSVRAQNYQTGIGLRGGPSTGITFKQFVSDNAAIEGIFSTRWGGWNITGLYEVHNRLFKTRRGGTGGIDTQRLHWYFGFGGHIGFWEGNGTNPWYKHDNRRYTVIGLDGVLGLEYAFLNVPLSLGIDYKPAFNIVGYSGFWGDEGALSLRYIF